MIISPIAISPFRNRSSLSAGEAAIADGNTFMFLDYLHSASLTDDGGGLISSWMDKLGSGRYVSGATTQRPTLGATGIVFNGSANTLGSPSYTAIIQPCTIYLVLRQISWTNVDYVFDGKPYDTSIIYQRYSTPELLLTAGTASGALPLTIGSFGILRIHLNGANSSFRIDTGTASTGNFGTNNPAGVTLGSRGNGGNPANVEYKAALIRLVNDSSDTDDIIYNYLKGYYGI
jgi:hypothetical protein